MKRRLAHRIVAAGILLAQVGSTIAVTQYGTRLAARAASFTCAAGKDGSPGTLNGVYNTYYKPPAGTIVAGATSINVGTIDTAGGGASTAISALDELLIIQMQDGTLNTSNSSAYGMTSAGNAGLYEYVQVASIAGSTATIVGAGSGGGLINSYTEATANGTQGQRTYQIVRVPQYVSATLSSTFHAAYWDGSTGGVAVLDIANTLNLGGASIYATGNGFRGAGVSITGTTPASVLNTDWVDSATMNGTPTTNPPGQGFKGEGILGTPAFMFEYTNFSTPSTPTTPQLVKTTTDGYPGGDMAMGAPGNAGGGGTDDDPAANDQNTGGGGGGNGGAGGNGGYPWSPNNPNYAQTNPAAHTAGNYAAAGPNNLIDIGGRGAVAMTPGATRIFMGGGGGAGSNNNGSNNNPSNNYGSSGGVGGGIVMMRIATTSGSNATIYADGTTGLAPDNDGGGGGGAGGSIVVTSPYTFTGITAYARGAAGTSAYYKTTDTTLTTAHGPGGGGGGGTILSSSPVSATVSGGAHGVTVYNSSIAYGATSGSGGLSQAITASSIPGVPSGAECYSPTGATAAGYIGPVDGAEATYGGADETGSYDGSVTATSNNDFTARSFVPSGANFTNSGTVPGTPIGNTLTGTTTVSVPNWAYYKAGAGGATLTFTGAAPSTPSGWTVRLCPDSGTSPGSPDCTGATTSPFSPSTAGSTTSFSGTLGANVTFAAKVWAVYAVPANTTAFTRYDAVLSIGDGSIVNYTHNELYAGFIPITKSTTVVSTGCPSGQSVPASGACPGGVIRYTLDYRNIMLGAGKGSEGQLLAAFLSTQAGQLTISDNGAAGSNNWGTYSNGLKEALLAGLGASNTTCGATANTCGDSVTGTTFTGNTVGSTSFSATVGGSGFVLAPSGYSGGTAQGTITFSVVVK